MLETDRATELPSTRERILGAAREVYERHGTRGTTTREIAERAGVNEATIFRHFGNKVALLQTMREEACNVRAFSGVVDSLTGDLQADLEHVCQVLVANMARNRNIMCIGLAEQAIDPGTTEMTLAGPRKLHTRLIDYLNVQKAAGKLRGDTVHIASVLMGMTYAMSLSANKLKLMAPDDTQESFITSFVSIILEGVRSN